MVCNICGVNFNQLGSHIKKIHGIETKDYFDKYLKTDTDGICPCCGKETTFKSLSFGYHKYCSLKCAKLFFKKCYWWCRKII